MKKAHFICQTVEQGERVVSIGGFGRGLKSEKMTLTITLISSGNTDEIKNTDINRFILNQLREVR